MGESQFGFRKALGTREALYSIQVLVQKCLDHQKPVYICFVDVEKAFDTVIHTELIRTLGSINIGYKELRIIKELYWNQTATVKINNIETNKLKISKGVRQGCVLSPTLFNIYSEIAVTKALTGELKGIKINGEYINCIRYADDMAIITENIEELNYLLQKVNDEYANIGLNINKRKTKMMIVNKTPINNELLLLNNEQIKQVSTYNYLGCQVNEIWDPDQEIKVRIEKARNVFIKMKQLLCNRQLDLDIRWRMVQCYVLPVLLYGAETWTLKIKMMNRLESFEMWMFRRMLRIPWTARVTNDEVLRRMARERQLLRTIKHRKTEYFGHIMRNSKYRVLQLIMMGRIEGKRRIGRRNMSWFRNLRNWTGLGVQELFNVARDRGKFSEVVANII